METSAAATSPQIETVTAPGTAATTGQQTVRASRSLRPRRIISTILIIVTALLSMLSLVAGYVRGELLTTERYVQIVAPLARDAAVQDAVVEAVTTAVVENVRVGDLTEDALELLRARDGRLAQLLDSDRRLAQSLNGLLSSLGPLLQNQLETATRRAAERVVESPRFAELWVEANRAAHAATLAALRDQGSAVRTDDGEVRIDLSVIMTEVKQRLVDSGFALADRIPVTDQQIVLVRSEELAKAQTALRLFDQIAPWVPWVTLALAAAAVAVAPNRRRALVWLGLAVAVAMTLVAVTLAVGRGWFLNRVADTSVEPAAAAAIADAALDPLWSRLVFILVVALLIALVALIVGPVGGRLRAWVSSRTSAGSGPSTGSGP